MDRGEFFVRMALFERALNFKWEIIIVYGPADHRRSASFLDELKRKVSAACLPVVVGGDFNLLRFAEDKSNGLVNFPRMQMFNDCIAKLGLRELHRIGAGFTWTNRQADPTRSVLDRVLVSPEWEHRCPLASLHAITRIGSDHVILLLSSQDDRPPTAPRFRFETFCLNQNDFAEAAQDRWMEARLAPHRSILAVDDWHFCAKRSRQFMKGWGANLGRDLWDRKKALLASIQALDLQANSVGLAPDEWLLRYDLEDQLTVIYTDEEAYWRLWGTQKWVLEGDANTAYFQAIANGRRRRNTIPLLWDGETLLQRPAKIRAHVDGFYKALFPPPRGGLALATDFWVGPQCISPAENAALTAPFTEEEVWEAINGMNPSSAPGPDGLPVKFFQTFWTAIKPEVMALFEEFYVGTIDLHRLNYGIITLIPKVPGASDIRQFLPITVINVIFRILAKGYANRVAPLADRITHPDQSAFIQGRYIPDGVLVFHEVLHEVQSKNLKAIFLKIDFHKAYDAVSWSFLREVLLRKGFDDRWVTRVMQMVASGHTAVNINGEIGPYFPTLCGVRQGDPFSPFMFNMVVDALATILDKAKTAGATSTA
uniref:Reverse transcriptase domain-containing protein n=1 Tax=Aegilops tauschii subsp. strangulata TaxID=200361 RepID=A0A453EWV6_AEGTS